ncbi:hypothetical protein BISA_0853 [Bifidobacterium saguini DSM 23967]|uniref:Uncharacterized protein n=2 Tax=Bifidobacterium saguini TaxID=762210 RepID=A0A087DAA3_9BIFI|nr:hypothetical protein [Bifidobacterium saguini]KFI92453.1 hypothetical protein BISA_0853 [Bifidobacterium saguini DSM 23967]QTB90822.1 hypothetical protein BSD967_11145 [Bifidobacterium saguini]QTB90884.1 hypothetical protein BSD967_11480 [Bifidobacterium saguini]
MTSEIKKERVRHWHERNIPDSEIVRLLGIPEAEVKAIISNPPQPRKPVKKNFGPEFIEPPAFFD